MKKFLSQQTLEFAQEVFGGLDFIQRCKKFYSVLLIDSGSNKLNIVIKNEKSPSFKIDWEMFCFIRAVSNVHITSGKTMRYEAATDFNTKAECFGRSDWEELYHSQGKKTAFVLSRKLAKEEIQSVPYYFQTKHLNKILTSNPTLEEQYNSDSEFREFAGLNNISLCPQVSDIKEAIDSIQKIVPNKTILVEVGVEASLPLLEIDDPNNQILDFLVISVYKGKLDEQFIGNSHHSIEDFKKKFYLYHSSKEFQSVEGTIQFHSFVSKKIWEISNEK